MFYLLKERLSQQGNTLWNTAIHNYISVVIYTYQRWWLISASRWPHWPLVVHGTPGTNHAGHHAIGFIAIVEASAALYSISAIPKMCYMVLISAISTLDFVFVLYHPFWMVADILVPCGCHADYTSSTVVHSSYYEIYVSPYISSVVNDDNSSKLDKFVKMTFAFQYVFTEEMYIIE